MMINILSLINRREAQLLVHSYLYYELDKSLISDDTWTKWAFELYDLIRTYPEEFEKSRYAWIFEEDFDPSSGYYLNYRQPEIMSKAHYLLRINGLK